MFYSSVISALPAKLADRLDNRLVAWILLGALVLLPISYLLVKVLLDRSDTVDFKYFWLAGHVWSRGIDPFTSAYAEIGDRLFVGKNRPPMFFYPPNWYLPARLLALIPYESAVLPWRILSVMLVVLSLKFWLDIYQAAGFRFRLSALAIFYSSALASTATAMAISMGQTSPLIFFGMSLFFKAKAENRRLLMVAALWLLMLKPNVGLLFCIVLIPSLVWWPSLIAAAAVTIASSLPALLPFGLVETLSRAVAGLGQYDAYDVNNPTSTTGLRNLIYYISGMNVSAFALASAAYVSAFAAAAIGCWRTRKMVTPSNRRVDSENCLYIALAASILSLHTYDLIILAPLALLCYANGWKVALGISACLLVLIRGKNIAALLGLLDQASTYFPESYFYSLFLTIILLFATLGWLLCHRAEGALPIKRNRI